MKVNKPKAVAGVTIPDSIIASQAMELLLEHGTEFLYNHSLRTFVFASLHGQQKKMRYDPELLYVSAVFHDLGLTSHYSSPDEKFEVDGANAARDFLKNHGLPQQTLQLVWDTIALHTSGGVAKHKEAEVALLNYGVELDVVGKNYEHLDENHREEIIRQFPRIGLKHKMIPTLFEGFKHKTDTTYGSIDADVCAFMIPNFQRTDFCDLILHSPWSE